MVRAISPFPLFLIRDHCHSKTSRAAPEQQPCPLSSPPDPTPRAWRGARGMDHGWTKNNWESAGVCPESVRTSSGRMVAAPWHEWQDSKGRWMCKLCNLLVDSAHLKSKAHVKNIDLQNPDGWAPWYCQRSGQDDPEEVIMHSDYGGVRLGGPPGGHAASAAAAAAQPAAQHGAGAEAATIGPTIGRVQDLVASLEATTKALNDNTASQRALTEAIHQLALATAVQSGGSAAGVVTQQVAAAAVGAGAQQPAAQQQWEPGQPWRPPRGRSPIRGAAPAAAGADAQQPAAPQPAAPQPAAEQQWSWPGAWPSWGDEKNYTWGAGAPGEL